MESNEYYNITTSLIPQNVINKYNIMEKKVGEFLYERVEKGIYRLVQYRIISHKALKKHLLPFIYASAPIT